MFHYSITIKCNQKAYGNSQQDIQQVYDYVISVTDSKSLKQTFELDSKSKLHLHGYLSTSAKIHYASLRKKGWNIYLRRVYHHTGWYRYLMKDVGLSHAMEDDLVTRIQSGEYCFRT